MLLFLFTMDWSKALFCKQSQTLCYKCFFFFFHRNLIYVYLKKASCAVCGETCAILVTTVCISYFASQICINPTRNTFLVHPPPSGGGGGRGIITHKIFDKSMFSGNVLKCNVKRSKPFFIRKHAFVKKTCVLFSSLSLYIYFLETTKHKCLILCR